MIRFGTGPLEVACASFQTAPPSGTSAAETKGVLEARVFALRQGEVCVAFGNSDIAAFEARRVLSEVFGVGLGQTVYTTTGNHSGALASEGRERFLAEFGSAAASVAANFRPVDVSWGTS